MEQTTEIGQALIESLSGVLERLKTEGVDAVLASGKVVDTPDIRPIAYPDGYQDGTPEPTALEQLPEAVRDQMRSFGDLAVLCGLRRETADDIFEALARVILDNAAEIFAAGEPVHGMCINGKSRNKIATALSIGNRSVWAGLQGSDAVFGDVNFVKECRPSGTGLHLSAPNALAFARRTVAIALAARKNAQGGAS